MTENLETKMSDAAVAEMREILDKFPIDVTLGVIAEVNAGRITGESYWLPVRPKEDADAILEYSPDSLPCGCFKGTVALKSGIESDSVEIVRFFLENEIKYMKWWMLSLTELEEFVYNIHYGHTPENNVYAYELHDQLIKYLREREARSIDTTEAQS